MVLGISSSRLLDLRLDVRGQAVVAAAGNHSDNDTSKQKVGVGLLRQIGQTPANLPKNEGHA